MGLSNPQQVCDVLPWYKQGWPWFLVSIPAVSVVLGINLLYLAHQTNNSLVVDDYYKQGKSISQYAERDRGARNLKLSAKITAGNEGIKLQLSQISNAQRLNYPDILILRWVHVTQSHKDGTTTLQHYGGGWYFDNNSILPDAGYWRIHVEPDYFSLDRKPVVKAANWRLVSDRITLDRETSFTIDYRL